MYLIFTKYSWQLCFLMKRRNNSVDKIYIYIFVSLSTTLQRLVLKKQTNKKKTIQSTVKEANVNYQHCFKFLDWTGISINDGTLTRIRYLQPTLCLESHPAKTDHTSKNTANCSCHRAAKRLDTALLTYHANDN